MAQICGGEPPLAHEVVEDVMFIRLNIATRSAYSAKERDA
jgi:hypothetical protein